MFIMYQDCVSPHQVPLAQELVVRLGAENFRYVYRDKVQADRVKLGWRMRGEESWFVHIGSQLELSHDLIENAKSLLTMFRDTDLIARRSAKGLKTFYDSERWFKPIVLNLPIPLFNFNSQLQLSLPGWLKLFVPGYFKMAMKMAALLFKDPNFRYLPIGPHAARDMRLICRVYSLLHLHLQPTPAFIPWGYFVEPTTVSRVERVEHGEVKVLYVGRLLKLKHVDTIIRAVALLNSQPSTLNHKPSTSSSTPLHFYTAKTSHPTPTPSIYTLTIVGDGPEKSHLQKLATTLQLQLSTSTDSPCSARSTRLITFSSSVPIVKVRPIMRQHDIFVFASDASDGWGAVVSEALSEGVPVIGTYETGASAALLPDAQLFHCGNYKELAKKLSTLQLQRSTSTVPKEFTPSGAAEKLIQLL